MIELEIYRDAKKVLLGGTAPVFAHVTDGAWARVLEVKAIHGAFVARFFSSSDAWIQIDGLEIRK